MLSTSVSPPVNQFVLEHVILIIDNFEDHDPKLPIGPSLDVTPLPIKVTPPYPLRTKLKENYYDMRAMFENIRMVILLLDVI